MKKLKSVDWKYVFEFAEQGNVNVTLGSTVSSAPFSKKDVAEVFAFVEGENEGPSWIAIFKLRDGRYGCINAWCDYTGWDCRADGRAFVSHSLDHLWRYGMDDDVRKRLKSQMRAYL